MKHSIGKKAGFAATKRLRGENALLKKQVAWLAAFLDEFCADERCGECWFHKYCPYGYRKAGFNVSSFADISRIIAEEEA